MAKALLTDRAIQRHAFTTKKPVIIRDTKAPGLMLRIGRESKTLSFQVERRGKTVFRPIGEWDGEGITVDFARKEAGRYAQELREGKKLASRRDAPTVRQAFDEYIEHLRGRGSTSWADTVQGFFDRNFADIASRKLATLSGETDEMVKLHKTITEERGPYEANRAMQTLRAVYRRARLRDKTRSIPAENPVEAFGALKVWNDEKRAQRAVSFEDLGAWGRAVNAIEKERPIRAAYHRLCLMTGARPGELRRVRKADVNWKERTFVMSDTKTGLDVTIPMTPAIAKQFKMAIKEGNVLYPDSEYVFPANSKSGHLMEPFEAMLPAKLVGNFGRHQYIAIGEALDIRDRTMRMLTGRKMPKGDAHVGYGQSRHDVEQLMRPAQEKLSKRILQLLAAKPPRAKRKRRAAKAPMGRAAQSTSRQR